jgi:hypothetical protein
MYVRQWTYPTPGIQLNDCILEETLQAGQEVPLVGATRFCKKENNVNKIARKLHTQKSVQIHKILYWLITIYPASFNIILLGF